MREVGSKILVATWFPLLSIAVWQALTMAFPHPFFPEPREILSALVSVAAWEWFLLRVWPTLLLIVGGFVGGSVTGVLLGISIASHNLIFRSLSPIAIFIRSLPSAAVIPIILALFGIGDFSLLVAVTVAVTFQVTLVTMVAIHHTDVRLIEFAKVVRMSRLRVLFLIRLPGATSQILTGVQAALQVAILVAITVELLAGGNGIGRFAAEALETMRIENMWVSVVVIGVMGVLLHEAFHVGERKLFPWYFEMRKRETVGHAQ